ncbi:carbamoyl-phosphate synthase (glutamine-hydrolyzing) cpa2, partial [Ascosphaera atra]
MAYLALRGQRAIPSLLRHQRLSSTLSSAALRAGSGCSYAAVNRALPVLDTQRQIGSSWALSQQTPSFRPKRPFSTSIRRLAAVEKPPSADAYMASGAVKGSGQKVDVKKVLVIGSGGISIGQAGEFDYS